MSTHSRTGHSTPNKLARGVRLALASALLSLSASGWAAGGVIVFHGAIVVPTCATEAGTGGTASLSCPPNGTNPAEFAALPLLPGRTAMLKSARASVQTVRLVNSANPGSSQQGYIIVAEYY